MQIMSGNAFIKNNQGFSLLEVMVAVLVVAVGLLGIAILFVEGLKAERTSIYRTAAVSLASEMADCIRVNPDAVVAYQGVGQNNNCRNGPADCTAEQLATDDLFWWQQAMGRRLPPGATGTVTVTPGVITNQYVISVTWSEAGYATPRSYAVSMSL